MAGISDSGSLQFWQGVAGVVGAAIGGFFIAIGRRAGAVAKAAPDGEPAGDALQRKILEQTRAGAEASRDLAAEIRGMRSDWRDLRDRFEERFDDLRHGQSVGRRGSNEIRVLLRELIDRQPERVRPEPRAAGTE